MMSRLAASKRPQERLHSKAERLAPAA